MADDAGYDPKELEEDVDLDVDQRKRILGLFYKLDTLDHYGLLGIPRGSDKKAVKRAYFELTAHVHPDRFFRKRLGAFKSKMEVIFGRITVAHDVLTDKTGRTEYDTYLADIDRSRGIETMLRDVLSELEKAEKLVIESVPLDGPLGGAPSAEAATVAPVPPSPAEIVPAPPVPPPAPAPPSPAESIASMIASATQAEPRRPSGANIPAVAAPLPGAKAPPAAPAGAYPRPDDAARRAVLARRLLGGHAPAPPPRRASTSTMTAASAGPASGSATPNRGGPSPAPAPSAASKGPHESTTAAMDALRRRYDDRVATARKFQAQKYADNAQAAIAQNDLVAAANAYRVAASLAPEDSELKRAHEEAQAQANGVLSESYERQATYEEKSEKWEDAARSWQKVVMARPGSANPAERAANALVRSGGNLHEAVALARKAVSLEPDNPHFRATLASAYLAAGLTLNAKREVEAAAQISPHDGTIQALMKKVGMPTA